MKVSDCKIKRAEESMAVIDCFVDRGLIQGGHSALPDIDVDYASDRRSEMKEYLEERYNVGGRQRVFSAGTFTTMKLKAALKDVARVHRVPHALVNYITAIFDDNMDWTGLFRLAAVNRKVNKFIHDYPQVIEDMRGILGQPKATSIHASAIIVTPEMKNGLPAECFDFLPIRKMDGLLVSEFDGYAVDEIGLLKEDVLATKELAKLSAILSLINKHYGQNLTIEKITSQELNDEKTYQLLSAGYTQNIFQFSSKGITRFIQDVQPTNIEDLIAINALYRPATLDIGATEDYIRYKRAEVAPVYNFGCYNATKDTYGIMVYQEQFMSIAHTLGGFDLGKTDYLRKAIGKKKADLMASLKVDFIAGAVANGCPDYEAEEIWHKIETAGKYSFNRSHAAAYALTAYCGAWLKTNYPTAFYTVALQWADDKEIPALMSEMELCSRARIVSPDINLSQAEFYTDYKADEIYWSLSRIKMIGIKTVDYIVHEREQNGDYTSLKNFIRRIFSYKLRKYRNGDNLNTPGEGVKIPVNTRHVKHLILSGCFDKVEGISAVVERKVMLEYAAQELGFELDVVEFPPQLTNKHYFWSMQQIAVSSIGSIDYRRIYDCSDAKSTIKGKAVYMSLQDVLNPDNEGRRVAVCVTVNEVDEIAYTEKSTGLHKKFCKLTLQQNNDLVEAVLWSDFYEVHHGEVATLKGHVAILTAAIKYSNYSGSNTLNSYKTSLLFLV